jgi:hypothetical protein
VHVSLLTRAACGTGRESSCCSIVGRGGGLLNPDLEVSSTQLHEGTWSSVHMEEMPGMKAPSLMFMHTHLPCPSTCVHDRETSACKLTSSVLGGIVQASLVSGLLTDY